MITRLSAPSRAAIFEYWQQQPLNIFQLDVDSGLQCFACQEGEYGNHRVERAHIVARSTGGEFAPENFLLLCAECHREAPMTSDPEILLSWALKHESWGDRLVREVTLAIRKYDIQSEDITMDNLKGWQEMMEATDMRFHPRSLRQEKINLIAMMLSEYLRRVKWTTPAPEVGPVDEWV